MPHQPVVPELTCQFLVSNLQKSGFSSLDPWILKHGKWNVALSVYFAIQQVWAGGATAYSAELHDKNTRELTEQLLCLEKCLIRIYGPLEKNPFLVHLVDFYYQQAGSFGESLREELARALSRVRARNPLAGGGAAEPPDQKSLVEALKRQGVTRTEADLMPDHDRLLMYHSQEPECSEEQLAAVCRRCQLAEAELGIFLSPFNRVSKAMYDAVLERHNGQDQFVGVVRTARASNALVDYLYKVIVERRLDPQRTRLVLYEFVSYNLAHGTIQTVALLGRMILSLQSHGLLGEEYNILFASFAEFLGKDETASKVYLLSR